MPQRRVPRSQMDTIVGNPIRNHNFDFARTGDTFTGITNNVTGGPVDYRGVEYLERWYFHAKGPAVFSVSRVQPALDTRYSHKNEIGNMHWAMRIEVTTAAALGPDDYYLFECYMDGGDLRGLNLGAGVINDPNFSDNINHPQDQPMAGTGTMGWRMRTNIMPGSGVGGNYTNPGVDDPHFHFFMVDQENLQLFAGQMPIVQSTGNYGVTSAPNTGGTSPDNFQWGKCVGSFRGMPMLNGPVSGVPPAIAGGANEYNALEPGRLMMRWGVGLSGGANFRMNSQTEEGFWGAPDDISKRFLADDHTGGAGIPGQPVTDFTETVGNFVEIACPMFESGLGDSRCAANEWGIEKMQCEKYLQTSYQTGVFPGTAAASGGRIVEESSGHSNSVFTMKKYVRLSPSMVNLPSVTVYSPTTGTANRVEMNGVDVTPDSIEVFEDGFIVEATGAASTVRNMEFHFVASAELI